MLRNYIYSLMTDKRSGAIADALKIALYAASLAYALAIRVRVLLYRLDIFRANKVPIKIVSVGNITLGGTGKTPFVIWLARLARERLYREVSVLIRGYGWDEQAMLKYSLAEIPVLVGEDRTRLARKAIKLYGSRLAILDDGFQHWELSRDLNIVLIDSRNPFGNGHLFPRGILREPKQAISRADIVVFTKVDKALYDIEKIKEELKRVKGSLRFMEAKHSPKCVYDIKTKRVYNLGYLELKRVILVSAIGDPGYFEETAKGLKAKIVEHIIFPDHHNYTDDDISKIIKRCDERSFDMVLITDKDAVKFNRMHLSFGNYSMMVLSVEMEILKGEEILIDRLNSLFFS